jgi:hypothetical protein
MENLLKNPGGCEALTREQMKNIKGGVAEQLYSGGYCTNAAGQKIAGAWTYTNGPVVVSVCTKDISTYCASGSGGCTYASGNM